MSWFTFFRACRVLISKLGKDGYVLPLPIISFLKVVTGLFQGLDFKSGLIRPPMHHCVKCQYRMADQDRSELTKNRK